MRFLSSTHARNVALALAFPLLLVSCAPDTNVPLPQAGELQEGWSRIYMEGSGSLDFPHDFLELQAGAYAEAGEMFRREYSIPEAQFVLQQPGLNALEAAALQEYRRLIFQSGQVLIGKTWPQTSNPWTLSDSEEQELEATLTEQYAAVCEATPEGGTGKTMRMTSACDVTIGEIAGQHPLVTTYLRQLGENPIVVVEAYYFGMGKRECTVTVSYRLEDEAVASGRFREVLDTLCLRT